MRGSLLARVWGEGGVRLLLGDAALVAALAVGAVALSLPRAALGTASRAEVQTPNGIEAVDLGHDGLHEVRGRIGVTTIEVRGGRLRVRSSPCPRQVCRHGGWIAQAGEMLVCLPNEVIVRLPGRAGDAPDALSR